MITTIATNENNDIYLGPDGNLVFSVDLFAVRDICANAMKTQLGELIYDVESGLPNFEAVWGGNPNLPQFEAAAKRTLLAQEGVESIENFELSVSSDVLNYSVLIITNFGIVPLAGSI